MLEEAWKQSLRNIQAHRRRSLLTLLTIGVGIFSVAGVRIFISSMESSLIQRIERLGASTVYVHHFPWRFSDDHWEKYLRRPRIAWSDYYAVRGALRNDAWVALRYDRMNEKVLFKGQREEARIIGISEGFDKVFPMEIKRGRFFRGDELMRGTPVAVIGNRLARKFAVSDEAVGLEIRYEGYPIRVVGVLKAQGTFGGDMDEAVLVPLPFLTRIWVMSSLRGDRTLLIRAQNPETLPIDLLEVRVRGILRKARHLSPSSEDNFAINRQDVLLSQVREITSYIQIVGLFIAGFSLLVGGIGVANILYIAVRERRGEIGIQRAMGASRRFILTLFLLEGVLLTLTGGAVGITLTFLLVEGLKGIAAEQGILLSIRFADIIWALSINILIGLMAAIAPALQAAYLHPIEAIRTAA
ncbi:MAG: ABC transporter permease [Bacteroidia bacterium]|nr:ABC transporter permease [Bacteroidia bacterium]MDW8236541.1 ABC transporter permease [Bacteroidia bacterium]